jgi:hypothetical protein
MLREWGEGGVSWGVELSVCGHDTCKGSGSGHAR